MTSEIARRPELSDETVSPPTATNILRQAWVAHFLPVALVAVAYRWLFPLREDYLGHFAAGYGGTVLLLLASIWWFGFARPTAAWAYAMLILALVSIGLGAVTEATVFRYAEFDQVDFGNQSLGAVMAGLAILGDSPRTWLAPSDYWPRALVGAATLALGFYYALG